MLTFNTYTILRYYTSFVFRTSLVRSHVDFGVDDQKCNFFEKENRITKYVILYLSKAYSKISKILLIRKI